MMRGCTYPLAFQGVQLADSPTLFPITMLAGLAIGHILGVYLCQNSASQRGLPLSIGFRKKEKTDTHHCRSDPALMRSSPQ